MPTIRGKRNSNCEGVFSSFRGAQCTNVKRKKRMERRQVEQSSWIGAKEAVKRMRKDERAKRA